MLALPLNAFHSASAGPVGTSVSGTSYLSEEMKERLAAGLAERTGDSDEESDISDMSVASGN